MQKQVTQGDKAIKQPSLRFSLGTLLLVVALIATGILVFEANLGLMLFLSWLIVIPAGLYLKHSIHDIEAMAFNMIRHLMQAVFILLSVGALVGAWMLSGTVPSLIYYGLNIISPGFFLVTALILSSLMSLFTGSSWGALGTLGVALMGVGLAMDINPGMIAGSIISGAFFGDKLSPLSDTTNLASSISGTGNVMTHIKHMLWTTVPAYVLTMTIFLFLGFQYAEADINENATSEFADGLNSVFNIGLVPLIPAVFVLVLLLIGKPAMTSILQGALVAVVIAIFYQGASITDSLSTLYDGFSVDSDSQLINELLNRGGIASMWGIVGTLIFAGGLGGILSGVGVLRTLLDRIEGMITGKKSLTIATMATSYLSVGIGASNLFGLTMTGTLMRPAYEEKRVRPENLSRTMEDCITMGGVAMPWNTSAIYAVGVLGVSAGAFIPFLFLSFLTPVFTILYALTGYTINKLDKNEVYGETQKYKSKFNPAKN